MVNGPEAAFFGRLAQDPGELRYTANAGIPYITARVVVNTYRGPQEETQTHYFNVTLWRHHAENLLNRCRKGQQVYVRGQYSFREYTRRDGTPGYSHDVSAREFRDFPETRRTSGTDEETAAGPAATETAGETAGPRGDSLSGDDDPFGDDLDSMEY